MSDSCDLMDCSLPGSSVHGILQAGILEWVAISFSRGSSWPKNWNQPSGIAGGCFTDWASREAQYEGKDPQTDITYFQWEAQGKVLKKKSCIIFFNKSDFRAYFLFQDFWSEIITTLKFHHISLQTPS